MLSKTVLLKAILIFAITLNIFPYAFSQVEIPSSIKLNFEDGKEFTLIILEGDPDKVDRGSIYAGLYKFPERLDILGGTYYIPKLLYANVSLGAYGGMADVSTFFINKKYRSKIKRRIRVEGLKAYKVKIPVERRLSIGLHLGIEHFSDFLIKDFLAPNINASGVIGGISILGAKYSNWEIMDTEEKRTFSNVSRINIDAIYYFKSEFHGGAANINPKENIRKIGSRIYYEGKLEIWRTNGMFSFHYKLGLELNLEKGEINSPPVIMGLGFVYDY